MYSMLCNHKYISHLIWLNLFIHFFWCKKFDNIICHLLNVQAKMMFFSFIGIEPPLGVGDWTLNCIYEALKCKLSISIIINIILLILINIPEEGRAKKKKNKRKEKNFFYCFFHFKIPSINSKSFKRAFQLDWFRAHFTLFFLSIVPP